MKRDANPSRTLALPVAHKHLADKVFADKLKAALEELDRAAVSQEEIRPFVDFIRRSSRSIVR